MEPNIMKLYLLFILTLCVLPATATELSVQPGLWETTTTRTSSIGGGAVTKTDRECIKEHTFKPEAIMQDLQNCELSKNELQNNNTLLFEMTCSMQGAKASLKGKYYTKGDEGNGDMKVQVDMGGMKMNMDITWDSKRVGDC